MSTIFDFSATALNGKNIDFSNFEDKVLLIVNTSSQCIFRPQFHGLENLCKKFKKDGLVIVGFPCNQFLKQEKGSSEQIQSVCQERYRISFQMMKKIKVNGNEAHEIYQWLKSHNTGTFGQAIKWNFTKFLLGRDGNVIKRFAPIVPPSVIETSIINALASS